MIFGYSSNAFIRFSISESIEKIANLGYKGIEIMCDKPHLYPPEFDDAALASVREALDRHGLKITNLNCFTLFAVGNTYLPSWIELDAERRRIRIEHTLHCIDIAHKLGAASISIPPGGPMDSGIRHKEAVIMFHNGLQLVIPEAEAKGIKLLIEPEPELMIENTEQFKSFMVNIRSKAVGLNFDIGHFYCVGEDPAVAFEELREYVGHVHLEDIAADRRHEHLIPGHGAIDFANVLKTMKRLDYEGDITLELYPYTEAPEAAGEESLAFMMPLFAEAGFDLFTGGSA